MLRFLPSSHSARTVRTLVVTLAIGLMVQHPVWAGNTRSDLAKCLEKLPQSRTVCGAVVIDLATGDVVYELNASKPLIPASNQKLIVMAAALDRFGSTGAFRTTLASRGQDLIVIGDGDPALGDARLAESRGEKPLAFVDRWADALTAEGERTNPSKGGDAPSSWIIPGDFIVDATILDDEHFHPDWIPVDRVRWYGAPVGGLNLNNNCVEVTALPGKAAGEACAWSISPPSSQLNLINKCVTSKSSRPVPVIARREGAADLVLRGKVGKRRTLKSVSVFEPNQFAASAIRDALASHDIRVEGETRFERIRDRDGQIPSDVRIIAQHTTPISDVLRRVGTDSQNMCAEALFKRLGYESSRQGNSPPTAGSWKTGRDAVKHTLRKAGCDVENMVIADGSGLSRRNRLTARDLARLLQYMHTHTEGEVFKASLAGNRTGGKLKRRLSGIDADIYAKTGYLSGVRSLSGYVRTRENRWFAFSVIFNNFKGASSPYNKIHDKVCRILSNAGQRKPKKP